MTFAYRYKNCSIVSTLTNTCSEMPPAAGGCTARTVEHTPLKKRRNYVPCWKLVVLTFMEFARTLLE